MKREGYMENPPEIVVGPDDTRKSAKDYERKPIIRLSEEEVARLAERKAREELLKDRKGPSGTFSAEEAA